MRAIRILAALLVLLFTGSGLAQTLTLSLQDVSGAPGELVDIPVAVEGEFAALQFDVVVDDPRLTLIGFTADTPPAGAVLDFEQVAADRLRVVIYDSQCPAPAAQFSTLAIDTGAQGLTLGTVRIRIAAGAGAGDIALPPTDSLGSDDQANALAVSVEAGTLRILAQSDPSVPITVPTLPPSGLFLIALLLLGIGLFTLHRRGINAFVVIATTGMVWAALQPYVALAQASPAATAQEILAVILERQMASGNEDCNDDGDIDVLDIICARNAACNDDVNQAPAIAAIADQSVIAGDSFSFNVQASDPDGDPLTYSLNTAPPGMTISAAGQINWTTSASDTGDHPVTVQVTDPDGLGDSASFTVTVFQAGANLVRLSDPGNFSVVAGDTLSFTLQGVSSDASATLRYSKQTGPDDLSVTVTTGEVTWATDSSDLGSFSVRARVTDQGGVFDEKVFTIEVTDPPQPASLSNRAPDLAPIADRNITVGQSLTIQTSATDPDGDTLDYVLLAAPAGMTINTSGQISFTAGVNQAGIHTVTVRVSDPLDLSDTESFSLTVIGFNNPPVALDDGYDAEKGDTLSIPAAGVLANDSDPDSDALTAQLLAGPDFGSLDLNADGSFDYTPDNPAGTLAPKLVLEYRTTSLPIQQPLIADMDGNGVPDILYHTGQELGAVDGISHEEVFEVGIDRATWYDKAIADIDLDGRMEIVLIGRENGRSGTQVGKKMITLEHDGQLKWISEVLPNIYFRDEQQFASGDGLFTNAKVSIADLDQDGTPEIIVGHGRGSGVVAVGYSVFDNNGLLIDTVMAEGIKTSGQNAQTEIVDLDLDGDPEIVTASVAFSHEGEVIWSRNDIRLNNSGAHQPIAANLDDDPYPELIRRTSTGFGTSVNSVLVWNHDGSDLWQAPVPFENPAFAAPLVIADVNSDGQADILVTSGSDPSVTALDGSDGALLWSVEVPGNNRFSAATVLDLDRDGFNEVIYPYGAGTTTLLILDGRDGSVKRNEDQYDGNPISSMPIFADVDNDGASELILIGHQNFGPTSPAFFIYESENDDWPPMRGIWNQWNYHVTNINADGSVPQFEQPHWLLPGLNQNRVNERLPEERTETFDQFTYRASDGELSDDATVFLRVLENQNPPQILSVPDTTATVGFDYRYAPTVTDPDPGETFDFQLTAGPAGMTIDTATGLIRWTPATTGEFGIGLVVTDGGGLSTAQTWTLVVGEPVAIPDVVGLSQSAAETALTGADLMTGRITGVNDPSIPAGQVAGQNPPAGAVAEFGAAVDLTVSLGPAPADIDNDGDGFTENQGDCDDTSSGINPAAADAEGDDIDQNCDGIDGELNLQSIRLDPADQIVLSNRIIDYQATGIRVDGTAVNLNGLGNFTSSDTNVAQLLGDRRVRSALPGTATISLTYLGVTGETTLTVVAGVSGDETPPMAEITTPISAQEVTVPVEVIGTADDANLLRWELSLISGDESSEQESETLLAAGTSAVNSDVLGQLDPTLLLNGIYTLRLRVYDRGGNLTVARTVVEVTEQYKVGNFTLTFEDLNVDLAGLPITVSRSYDSRDKRRGDFGIGWTLGLKSIDIRANRVLGTAWESLKSGNAFQLNPTDDHIISVTLPGGEVETFELQISPSSSFLLPFSFLEASVTATGDTQGELEILDNPFLLIIDGQPGPVQLLDDATFDVFNPQRFRYTAPNGLEFVVHRGNGLEQFSDGNGNTLTFTDLAITHSNGTEVRFQRDSLDRITRLIDPEGNRQTYAYDSSGNLASHTDAEGNVSRFRYNRDHGLLEVIDPRGHRAVRNEYDDEGRLITMIDAAGNRVEFTHDIAGREELIRDANGNVQRLILNDEGDVLVRERTITIDGVPTVATEQFQYDARGNQIVQIDADGQRTELTYDADDNLLQTVVDPGGLNITTSSTYDADGNRLTETDALGRTTSFAYDADDNLLTITDPLGNVQRFSYASGGRIATRTDALGTVTSYAYDGRGALLGEDVTAADGTLLSRKTFTYNANGNKTSESVYRIIGGVLTPLTTTFAYDANRRLIRSTDALGNISRTEYDAAGNVSAQIDALGRRTEFSYSARGQRIRTTHADGSSTSQTYDGAGNVISRTDEGGRVTRFEYDELSRQIAVIHPDGAREEEVLSAGGRLLASIDARGNRTEHAYDAAGRRTTTTSPSVIDARDGSTVNPTVTQSYDAAGNVLTSTDSNGNTTTIIYNVLNRPIRTSFADGAFTTESFDPLGRVIASTDELGRTTERSYDGAGRLLSITQPPPSSGAPRPVTSYSWDMTGNLVTQTDALGRTTRMSYDRLNRQTRRTLPGGQFATASYDAVGNRVAQTDFNGETISISFDARNRPVSRSMPDGEVQTITYTATGARLSTSDTEGTQTFEHDARDRTTAIIQPDGRRLSYRFDASGNLIELTTPAQSVSYTFDALNRTTRVTSAASTTEYGYDPNGNQVLILRPNLAATETAYDARNRITDLIHRDASATVLESFTNTYLANGLRASVTERDGSVERYAYDGLNRLISETRTGANPRTVSYRYDAVGNRISVDRDGSVTAYNYDINNRLLNAGPVNYTFNANGNRTSTTAAGDTTLLNWNAENQLVSVDAGGSQTTYRYDINGNRTGVQSVNADQRFLVDPQNPTGYAQVVETRDGGGNLLTRYTYGTDLISADSGLPSYYHTDAHGNTRLLTNATAQATDSYVYDGYGQLSATTGSSDNDYLFAGEQFDEPADAYYLRARYYDPDTGVFLSRDPLVGSPNDPVTQHPYLYGSADPINNIDPTGLLSMPSLSELSIVQAIGNAVKASTALELFCLASGAAKNSATLQSLASLGANIGHYAINGNLGKGAKVVLADINDPSSRVGINKLKVELDAKGVLSVTAKSGSKPTVRFKINLSSGETGGQVPDAFDVPLIKYNSCGFGLDTKLSLISKTGKGNGKVSDLGLGQSLRTIQRGPLGFRITGQLSFISAKSADWVFMEIPPDGIEGVLSDIENRKTIFLQSRYQLDPLQ